MELTIEMYFMRTRHVGIDVLNVMPNVVRVKRHPRSAGKCDANRHPVVAHRPEDRARGGIHLNLEQLRKIEISLAINTNTA